MRLWRWWVATWDRREPATALAIVRIAVSVVMLVDLLWVARLGLVHAMWSPAGFGVSDAVGWYGVALVALALMLVGAATPVACVAYVIASSRLSAAAPECEAASDMI